MICKVVSTCYIYYVALLFLILILNVTSRILNSRKPENNFSIYKTFPGKTFLTESEKKKEEKIFNFRKSFSEFKRKKMKNHTDLINMVI